MNVALIGFGTVGKGVYEMIEQTSCLKCIAVLRKKNTSGEIFVDDISKITENKDIDVVAECIDNTEDAYKYAEAVLKSGKHFVTANKALVSNYGIKLNKLSRKNNCAFLFSAACGGSIPILLNLSIARETDQIRCAGGILNGTVNYILTKMTDEGLSYSDALRQAQLLGYAEADPKADVSGLDTLRKIILLSAVGFDTFFDENSLLCEGIEQVSSDVIKLLKQNNLVLKLVGVCGSKTDNKSCFAFVQPTAFTQKTLEANVAQNLNFGFWEGKNCGKMIIFGQGAGRYPTASNIMRDLTEIKNGRHFMLPENCVVSEKSADLKCKYVVIENGKISYTDSMFVFEMFERAEDSRKKGNSFFFASLA